MLYVCALFKRAVLLDWPTACFISLWIAHHAFGLPTVLFISLHLSNSVGDIHFRPPQNIIHSKSITACSWFWAIHTLLPPPLFLSPFCQILETQYSCQMGTRCPAWISLCAGLRVNYLEGWWSVYSMIMILSLGCICFEMNADAVLHLEASVYTQCYFWMVWIGRLFWNVWLGWMSEGKSLAVTLFYGWYAFDHTTISPFNHPCEFKNQCSAFESKLFKASVFVQWNFIEIKLLKTSVI